jgi:nicotinate-nucleotide adenylyltransferase
VYPRVLTEQEIEEKENYVPKFNHDNIIKCQAPIMKISSSFIRNAIKSKKDTRYLLTENVYKYVDEMNFYK